MRKIRVVLFLIALASALLGRAFVSDVSVDESLYLDEVAPGAVFSKKGGTPPHYASGPAGKGGAAFNSYDVVPGIRGYAGPIKVLVALRPDGVITGIKVLEHKETPNYVHRMDKPEFLAQFLGKSVNDPFEIDRDIDGISRATVSVKALADSVRESSREVAGKIYGLPVRGKGRGVAQGVGWIALITLFGLSMAAYYVTRHPLRGRTLQRLRDVVLILSIAVLGLWLSTPFSILHVFNLLLLRPSSNLLWYSLMGVVALSILIAGRHYCGWLCPFGAIAEFVGRLPARKWEIPVETDDKWREMKYAILGLVTVVVLISGRPDFGVFETYVTLFSFNGTAFAWAVLILSLVANLRVRRFWCRFLCPVAAFIGLFSRQDPVYVSTSACPMVNKPMPLTSECIRCNRCYRKAEGV